MKSKIKRHSRSVLAVILTLSMLVSCMMVGLIATDAARVTDSGTVGATADSEEVGDNLAADYTVYFTPSSSWTGSYTVYGVRFNQQGDKDLYWSGASAFDTGRTIGGNKVYKATVTTKYGYDSTYGGLGAIIFKAYTSTTDQQNDSGGHSTEIKPFGNKTWTSAQTFSGKYWDGDSWEDPAWDDASTTTPYYGLVGNVSNEYLASVNGSTTWTATDGWPNDTRPGHTAQNNYQASVGISTPVTGETGKYSITITTLDSTTLSNNRHSEIEVGFISTENVQFGFKMGNNYYNYYDAGGAADFTVPDSGVAASDGLYVQTMDSKSSGGSLKLSPGRTYTITVDQTQGSGNGSPNGLITITSVAEGPTPPSPGTWTVYYIDADNGNITSYPMTETATNSGIYRSDSKLRFEAASPAYTKIKLQNGTVFYGPESGSDTNFVAGATNHYNAIANKSGDFVFNGKNGEYYVWLDTNKNDGNSADYFWLEGDEDDTSTPVTQGTMLDTSSWHSTGSRLLAYKDSTEDDALNSGTVSDLTVYRQSTSNYDHLYVDLTSMLDTLKSASNMQIGFGVKGESNSYNKPGSDNKYYFIRPGYANTSGTKQTDTARASGVSSSWISFSGKSRNTGSNSEWTYHYVVMKNIDSDVTNIGLRMDDDGSKVTFTLYAKKTASTSKPTVTVYAKDGMIRSGYQTFSNTADTTIDKLTLIDGTEYTGPSFTGFSGTYTDNSGDYYAKLTSVPKGAKIKFKTTLNDLSPKYYVKAFCINGVSYEVYNKNTTGYQEMEWTIPSDFADNYVEITPIYYLNDDSNTKELKVEGFDKSVQSSGWGNTLAVYPYYSGKSSTQNAFGGYPGQPFVFYGGKYFIQIPITHDGTASGAEIRGLTLSNNYWDSRHKSLDSTLNDHRQTYDYDDFFKLYREKNPDTIIVYYKYKVAKDNYGDGYPYEKGRSAGARVTVKRDKYTTRGGGNGVETYLDYYDRDIDIFSNLITDSSARIGNNPSKKLLVISNGYVDTFVGDYATEWNIYKTTNGGTSYSYVTSIAPSVLYMNDLNSWDNYSNGSTTGGGKLGSYKSAYTTLQDYKGWGVEISYEKEIRNYSKDQANRLDARWFYSKKTDQIQAKVKIEYLSDGRYITDAFVDPSDVTSNQGSVTNAKAYFTNTNPSIKGRVDSGKVVVNSDKYFTFQAEESSTYKFVGWWLLRGDTYTEITEDMIGKSPMNSNDTYVARFEPMQSGTLSITHVIDPASQGSGTPYLTVTIKDSSNNIVEQFDKATGKTFSNSEYINEAYSSYTVEVALETDADDNSYFTTGTNPITRHIPTDSGSDIYGPGTNTVTTTNATVTKSFTVAEILAFANTLSDSDKSKAYNIQYYTTLNKYSYSYKYNITYTYISRFWGKQKFVRTGTIDSDQLPDYITGKQGDARLTAQFLKDQTPCETTFRQLINWNYSDATQSNSESGTTYTITATVNATNTVNDKVTAEYRLPYRFTNTAGTTWAPNPYTGGLLFDESVASDKVTTRIGSLFTTNKKTTDADFYQYHPDVPWTDELAAAHPMVTAAESVYKVTLPEFKFNEDGFALYTGHTEDEYLAILNAGSGLTADEIAYFTNTHDANKDPYQFSESHKLSAARELYDKAYSDQYLTAYKDYYADVYNFGTDTSTTRRYSYIEIDGETGAKTEWTDEIDVYTPNISDIKTTDTTKIAQKYFSYWNVTNTKNEFVAKVYSLDFNYSGYDNYFATPVYESNQDEFRALRGRQGTSTTITYLGETRNQWNVYTSDPTKAIDGTDLTGSTIKLASRAGQSADKILEDFALSYVHNGEEISKLSDDVEIGVVIQQLDQLDTLNGSYITTPSYYQNKYSGTVAASIAQIKVLSGRTTTIDSGDAKGVYVKSCLTNGKESLDNKNRLEYYFTFNNHKAVSGTSTTPSEGALRSDRLYAYRAFTYIKIGADEMVVSTIPAYFTFYDLAMM